MHRLSFRYKFIVAGGLMVLALAVALVPGMMQMFEDYRDIAVRDRGIAKVRETADVMALAADHRQAKLLAAMRYRAPSRSPPSRLLVLAASQDTLVNPECSRRLAAAWRAGYAEHPFAGHDLPLDDGPWVARQIRQSPADP